MKLRLLLPFQLCALLITGVSSGQTLGKERIQLLRNAVVQIYIDGEPLGTGFFINQRQIVTCFHVIRKAHLDEKLRPFETIKSIQVKFESGEFIDAEVHDSLYGPNGHRRITWGGRAYQNMKIDIGLLTLKNVLKSPVSVLRMGAWPDIDEGNAVYFGGHPGLEDDYFIVIPSMLSSKIDLGVKVSDLVSKEVYEDTNVDAGILSAQIKNGMSGSPVLIQAKNYRHDRVVGVLCNGTTLNHEKTAIDRGNLLDPEVPKLKGHTQALYSNIRWIYWAIARNADGYGIMLSIDYWKDFLNDIGVDYQE